MIKKAVIVALVLFIAYNGLIYLIQPDSYIPQSIQQENSIKIQEFFFSKKNKENIVIGSSVAAKLDANIAEDRLYNLAFRGKGVLDGMTIIRASNEMPKVIMIETNFVQRNQSMFEDDHLLNAYSNAVKDKLPALQQKNQPVNNLLWTVDQSIKYAKSVLKKDKPKKALLASKDTEVDATEPVSNETDPEQNRFFKQVIELKTKEYNDLLNPEDKKRIAQNLEKLKKHITYFQEKGVKIIFFEMPSNETLVASPGYQYIHNEVRKTFPEGEYAYIKNFPNSDFKTKDGVHLVPESAKRYTKLFLAELDKLK